MACVLWLAGSSRIAPTRRPGEKEKNNVKNLVSGMCVAVLGLAAMAMPGVSHAGNVGYYKFTHPSGCEPASPAAAIAAGGHTPVALSALNAASLAPLQGLVIMTCLAPYPGSSAVDAAVENGLVVMIDTDNPYTGALLPGKPALQLSPEHTFCQANVSIVPNADITSGPGGVLTDDSLDVGKPGGSGGQCSTLSPVEVASLPTGARPYVSAVFWPTAITAFSYPFGRGTVVFSSSQWMRFLPGTTWPDEYNVTGSRIYYANAIAWMMTQVPPPATTTCASEGYKGTQLTWCKNICESGLTGKALDTWIQRWISKYRVLPYCAVD